MKLKKINELFDVQYGNSLELINLTECEAENTDSVNFVSRTEKNNGVSGIVEQLTDLAPFEAGLISVAGSGNSVLSSFIQTKPFYTGFHVFILRPLSPMSMVEKLFYCYTIRLNQYKYNFGRQANKTLKDLLIPSEMPDEWKSLDINSLNNLHTESLNNQEVNIDTSDWTYFDLTDLFDISASRDELMNDLNIGGTTPYITSSDKMNGITSTVQEEPTNPAGTITANRGGSVGYFYYQPFPYKSTPVDVRILAPKFEINVFIGLFLKTILQLEKYRFNYSRKMGSDRLSEFKIKLPSEDGQPDWLFMEQYIKSLPYSTNLSFK